MKLLNYHRTKQMSEQETKIIDELRRRDKLMLPPPDYPQLAKVAGCPVGTIGNILNVLENKGLIERKENCPKSVRAI